MENRHYSVSSELRYIKNQNRELLNEIDYLNKKFNAEILEVHRELHETRAELVNLIKKQNVKESFLHRLFKKFRKENNK